MKSKKSLEIEKCAPPGAQLCIPRCRAAHQLEAAARQIDDAHCKVGFGDLVNHGVEQTLIDGLFAASRAFHALPRAEKLAIEVN